MKISTEQVLHIADLARLDIDPRAVDRLAGQVAAVLDYVDTLGQVDTEGVPPTTHAIDLTNAFREDTPHPHLDRDEALANAPEQAQGSFVVPKVIG